MTKGMIFKQWEVKAALEDVKSQKRVPVKVQPPTDEHVFAQIMDSTDSSDDGKCFWYHEKKDSEYFPVPHQVGDVVFVKETWVLNENKASSDYGNCEYRADYDGALCQDLITWKPSTNMRQEYARLWYEITGVRVERVRDISEEDAEAEGALMDDQLRKLYKGICPNAAYEVDFMDLWGFDHPKYPFDTSWCWVFDLKKAEED